MPLRNNEDDKSVARAEFAAKAKESPPSLLREFWDFTCHYKRWWLIPIIMVMLVVSVLVVLGGTGAAPFIYTLF